jgi:dTDP-4-amino-4,6-dideoxy-D-galactose acyltransferase
MIDYLSWDSEFFQKKTGRIDLSKSNPEQVKSLLNEAKTRKYKLIYLFTSGNIYIGNDTMIQFKGKLVDKKIVYSLIFEKVLFSNDRVSDYTSSEITEDLEKLAYLSGAYSRFFTDKHFEREDFYRLYKTWIYKSVKKDLADKVFIIRDSETIEGMVTLKLNNSTGEIGLIAVSEKSQGKGYGFKLIEACKNWMSLNEIFILNVTTQMENWPACVFYEKCGFVVTKTFNVYHFWL